MKSTNSSVTLRLFAACFIFLLLGSGCGSKTREAPSANATINQPGQNKDQAANPTQTKALAEGFDSSIKHPFVAVLRDAQTYDALRAEDSKLPKFDETFFKSNFMIAAFLGERPTSGFTISITAGADSFTIKEQKPDKDAIVSQTITTTFKLVAIPARSDELVRIVLDDAWKAELRLYKTSGWFKSQGVAGTAKPPLKGDVRLIRAAQLATFFFSLSKSDRVTGPEQGVSGSFTATVRNGKEVQIRRMSTVGLIDPRYQGDQADGVLGQDWSELYLMITSLAPKSQSGGRGEVLYIYGLADFHYDWHNDTDTR